MKTVAEVEYDVVVVGAGMAGVAAALASARRGLKTCLIEKTILNGGLATIGAVLYYLPLSDNRNQQVTFGIAEELLLASIKYGPGTVPDWKNQPNVRYGCTFNPASFIMAMDELLDDAGVELWYDTLLCGAQVTNGNVTALEVENKSGRITVKAKTFVDATGDSDIAYFSGAEYSNGRNFLSVWGMTYSMDAARKAVEENDGTHLSALFALGSSDTGNGHPEDIPPFDGINGKDVSRFTKHSRQLIRNYFKTLQEEKGAEGRKQIFPAALPAMCDYRMTRRIEGKLTLQTGDKFKHYTDSVGVAADWRGGNDLWTLPYRALVSKNIGGFFSAGRCLAAHGEAWQVFRVIQAAAMSGEAAGLAASMCAERNIQPDALSVPDLQNELKNRGFLLDMRELGKLPCEIQLES